MVLSALMLLLGLESTAHATVIAVDGFNYTVPTNLNGKTGGTGYGSNAWTLFSGYADPAVTAGSLAYSNGGSTLITAGNKVQLAERSRSTRNFSSPLTTANQTYWVSFRINQTDTGSLPINHAGFQLCDQPNGAGTVSIFLGHPTNATNWGWNLSGTIDQKAGAVTAADRNALLIYKLVFTSTQLTISMWVNPPLSEGSLGTPAITRTVAHSTNIASMWVGTGTAAVNYQMDEFRMGTTFADVAPTTLIASDSFAYTGNLNAKNGGTGFGSNAWTFFSGYADPVLTTGSLTYSSGSSTLITAGNKVQPAERSRSTRNFASPIATANQTYWVSFRINQTDTGAFPANHGGFQLCDQPNGAGTVSIFLGHPTNATNWGWNLSGTIDQKAGAATSADRNALLIYKLVFTSTQLTISMWVNPPLSEGSLGTAAITRTVAHSTNIASMWVGTGTAAVNYQMDEFRMGMTFADVAPATVQSGQPDIVIHAGNTPTNDIHGNWSKVADSGAGSGNYLRNPNQSAATQSPLAVPVDYVDVRFNAPANVPYRLWLRMKADNNSTADDSVSVQFDRTVNLAGTAVKRIGTTDAWTVTLEEDTSRGVSGWGWAGTFYGRGMIGDAVIFNTSGAQVMRIQRREDGAAVDQIVLSPLPATYFCNAPGSMKNDTVILAASTTGTVPTAETNVRVLCWNIHKGKNTAEISTGNLDRSASYIVRSGATLAGLNEVKGSSGQHTTLKNLVEAKTGKAWHLYYADPGDGTGNAILSQYPLSSTATYNLAGPRVAVKAQLTVNNTTFNFICTHLDAWTQANRISAANTLVSTMAGLTGPCVLVGDMNATPGSTEINTLMNACNEVWREAVTAGTATSYPDNPPVNNVYTHWGHIDYIFRTKTQTLVTTLSANVPDLRDPFTYATDPNGPKNSIGDLLAIGLFTGDATYGSNVLNTHDDLGIRPSDHNQVKAILKVGP